MTNTTEQKGMRAGFSAVLLACSVLAAVALSAPAAEIDAPVWWYGVAGAANFNFYEGTTQELNGGLTTPAPFHKGFGTGLYLAPALEYRPGPVWGAMLQLGYDDRRGAFDDAICPCGETATLSARPAYLSLEPSLRVAPFAGNLYVFAGPRVGLLAPWGDTKRFDYTREGFAPARGDFSKMRAVVFSGQIGLGYDLNWIPNEGLTRYQFSPLLSFQPRFGENPRSTDVSREVWAVSTLRAGLVLKFGRVKAKPLPAEIPEVGFSAHAPTNVVAWRKIHETFPLRNYVFFEEGESFRFPERYAVLTPAQAAVFREEDLQDSLPATPTGRSRRQLTVYRNILNIIGDRLRRNPQATLLLTGLSAQGPASARARAETVKRYLTDLFGIAGARITVGEREQPRLPSGRTDEDLRMLRAESQRVEIGSTSPEMLVQIGEGAQFMLKPVEIRGEAPGTDSVVFQAPGAERLASWMLEITESGGASDSVSSLRRFGPYTGTRVAIPAGLLLGNRDTAGFTATLVGRTRTRETGATDARKDEGKAGGGEGAPAMTLRREASFRLSARHGGVYQTTRFAILFDIDQARAVSSYERFLTEVVTAKIPDSATVFVRGRTDVVGDTRHNLKLSRGRAEGGQRSLAISTWDSGKRHVGFETTWTGEEPGEAPFGNATPEERCYNRTVIIDILPE